MKLLFVSKLDGQAWKGPSNSVPMQIKHQAEVDEVLWVNLMPTVNEEWKTLSYYLEPPQREKTMLGDLPTAFCNPDLIIFEGIYEYAFLPMMKEIWKRKIPYVLVPRSALTRDAQKAKALKKMAGNLLFFNKFIHKASAIHYLTEAEKSDSAKWKTPSFIVPNGMVQKNRVKTDFLSKENLVMSYVGRVEKYQKGLDLLVLACEKIAHKLKEERVSMHLYGPDRLGSVAVLTEEIQKRGLEELIFFHDGVFGEEKEKVLLESDVFFMTSRFEGLPMGMIEALAYGIPVLATKGTNLTEEIKANEAGWTSDNTVDGIAEMFLQMLREKECLAQKGENAKKLSQNYAWDSIAKQTHEEYEKIIVGMK